MQANHLVATVNGVEVRGRDLAIYAAADGDRTQEYSAQEYDNLLERALRRELTYQEAEAKGVTLSESQEGQMEVARESVRRRRGGDPNAVFLTLRGTIEEQLLFTERDAAARLLQNTLLEQAGVPSQHVTEERVLAYYEERKAEFPELPVDQAEREAAWLELERELRNRLIPIVMAEHEAGREAYFENLQGAANVQIHVVPGAAVEVSEAAP